MSVGFLALIVLLAILLVLALRQGQDFGLITRRFIEQFGMLVPRMLCALIAAGFIAQLLPKEAIAGLLGPEAGLWALPIAALAGLAIPAGPVIAFAIAAIFAKAGASTPALVTFVTAWSIFAIHRVMIYEIPLLGASFLRMRLVSVIWLPFAAGVLAFLLGFLSSYGAAHPV